MPRLDELQARVLQALAGVDPPWTLTGGGALAGFHLGHRTTRDLDLFWHGRQSIADVRQEVVRRLQGDGLEVTALRSHDAFASLRVSDGGAAVVVDLVADPVAPVESPRAMDLHGVRILVDTPHEIFVNKLCALLHRSELRDLLDIEALLAAGGDLERALRDAPAKDGGFSALTLGWVLDGWDVAAAARAAGLEARAEPLERFRAELLHLVAARPPE